MSWSFSVAAAYPYMCILKLASYKETLKWYRYDIHLYFKLHVFFWLMMVGTWEMVHMLVDMLMMTGL